MAEQSHREEMNAAIRAQRERQGTAPTKPGASEPEPPPAKPTRSRLLRRLRDK